jgi:hypothetical protein
MKFSIRDTLLVTVIVALVLGWFVDHRSLVQWGLGIEREKNEQSGNLKNLLARCVEMGHVLIFRRMNSPLTSER